jgi:ABC-type branched-subunit amino acid transport system substrate-binding protein/DNA-binding CsgD family transcriptional regulator
MVSQSTEYTSSLIMNEIEFGKSLQEISSTEMKVLKLFLQGQSDLDIFNRLHIKIGTVKSHISHICDKFGLKSNESSGFSHRDELIDLFIRNQGAWVANCVREQKGYPRWQDPIERTGSNFYLEQAKSCRDSTKAIELYKNAVKSDRSDPYAQIYLNNAKARQAGNPLRIGVVIAKAGNDFHEFASIQVLRGVANAQTEFNDSGGKNGCLLEIDIRNDGNRRSDAEEIAKKFADDLSILAIIGHHSSESTKAALHIYELRSIAVISPTSTSSTLSGRTFFRTVGSTKTVAIKYTDYIMDYLKLDKIAVIYHKGNTFSETLKTDFKHAFNQRIGPKGKRGQITQSLDILDVSLNILESIEEIKQESDAVLVISSIETNSVAIAIAVENFNLPQSQQLQLLFITSLPETPTLEKGGKALEGTVLVRPCLARASVYVEKARNRWEQEIDWRSATGYDATQAIIEAINRSTVATRKSILENLEAIVLDVDRTSGFGLSWSDTDYHANVHQQYGIWQVRHGRFEEI